MDTTVSLIQAVAALFGFGYALHLTSNFTRMNIISKRLGYNDNSNTNLAITSKFVKIKLFDYIKQTIFNDDAHYINIRNTHHIF